MIQPYYINSKFTITEISKEQYSLQSQTFYLQYHNFSFTLVLNIFRILNY